MAVRALFFDIDGTLVNSNELHVLAWHEAFAKHARDIPLQSIRRQIGKGADQKVAPIPANETLAVGDTIYDVLSAKQNGIGTAALRTGPFTDAELREAGALAIYDNIGDVLGNLDQVLRYPN